MPTSGRPPATATPSTAPRTRSCCASPAVSPWKSPERSPAQPAGGHRPGEGPRCAMMSAMSEPKPVECWLTDMDGVLVHEEEAIPGAADFLAALHDSGRRFLVLTNNSIFTPRDLRARLLASDIDVPESAIWTSALATAQFLHD